MNLNQRNQQILGMVNLVGGAANRLLGGLDTKSPAQREQAAKQKPFKDRSNATRASIRKYGIDKPSLTYVGISVLPKMFTDNRVEKWKKTTTDSTGALISDSKSILDHVNLRAERVNQPGIQILTSNVRRYGVGPIEKRPYTSTTQDVNISFIGDAGGVVHQFFYTWLNGVVCSFDLPAANGSKDIFGKSAYEVEYRTQYSTTIEILMYDEIQNLMGVIKLHNAYPVSLGEIQRDWSGINDLVRVPVSFTYSHWTYSSDILQITEPDRATPASQRVSVFDDIVKGMTAIQAISSVKRPQNVNDVLNVVNTGSTLLSSLLRTKKFDY